MLRRETGWRRCARKERWDSSHSRRPTTLLSHTWLLGALCPQDMPSSEDETERRKRAVAHLRSMVAQQPSAVRIPAPKADAAAAAAAAAGNGAAPAGAGAGAVAAGGGTDAGQYLQRVLPTLTSWEICELLDWGRVAANKAAFGW